NQPIRMATANGAAAKVRLRKHMATRILRGSICAAVEATDVKTSSRAIATRLMGSSRRFSNRGRLSLRAGAPKHSTHQNIRQALRAGKYLQMLERLYRR